MDDMTKKNMLEQDPYETHKQRYDKEQKRKETSSAIDVVITGVDIPFWDLIVLLIKIGIAAVPAGIILTLIFSMFLPFLFALFR